MRASMVSPTTTLNSLPLPPSALELLAATDFVTVADLDGLTAQDLAEELSSSERPVTTEHAARLLLMVRSGGFGDDAHMAATSSGMAVAASAAGGASLSSSALHFPAARSALSLLREERASRRIITFARELDELLGGGVAPKMLTEFAGAPGVGKTQVAMQLALNAQIPPSFGGVGGRSAYIDSEGSFLAPRCLQMAEALVRFLHAAATTDQQRADANALQPRAMLDAILVYRVHDALEQLAAIRAASEVQREEAAEAAKRARAAQFAGAPPASSSSACLPPLKLVVVDSIAFHLRHSEATYTAKQQLQGKMAQSLCSLALHGTDGSGLAVVVINQVTTKVNDAIGSSSLVPALGESWAHVCNVQLMLAWRDGMRVANLYKGGPPGDAVYVVSAEGVRSRDAPPPPSVAGQGPPAPQPQMQRSQPSYTSGKRPSETSSVAQHPPPPALRYADGNQQAYHQHGYAQNPPGGGAGQAMQQLRHEERSW